MARKNRPTLIQQFSDFINRVAPFDGNALIQKTEHNQVEDDLFDSLLNNTDSSELINSPSAAINLDFSAFDMFRINSSGSGETNFDITISNLGTGQVARVHITKKNNDSYSFTNAVLGQISNLSQTGSILAFWVHNINGVLVAYADVNIAKSNSITDPSSDKLATSKAVSDLNTNLIALDERVRLSAYIDGSDGSFIGSTINNDIWTISRLGTGGYGIFINAVHLTDTVLEASDYLIEVTPLTVSGVSPSSPPSSSDRSTAFIYEDVSAQVSIGTSKAGSIVDLNFMIMIQTRS